MLLPVYTYLLLIYTTMQQQIKVCEENIILWSKIIDAHKSFDELFPDNTDYSDLEVTNRDLDILRQCNSISERRMDLEETIDKHRRAKQELNIIPELHWLKEFILSELDLKLIQSEIKDLETVKGKCIELLWWFDRYWKIYKLDLRDRSNSKIKDIKTRMALSMLQLWSFERWVSYGML